MKHPILSAFFILVLAWAPITARAISDDDISLLCKHQNTKITTSRLLVGELSSLDDALLFLRQVKATGPYFHQDTRLDRGAAARLLEILGDRQSIEEIYDLYLPPHGDTGRGSVLGRLASTGHPEVMVVVGRDLERAAGKIYLSGEMGGFETPYSNAYIILGSAAYSGFFRPDVSRWAKSILEERSGWERSRRYLDEVRAFWAENREKIEAGQYDLVQPPKAASHSPTPATPTAAPETTRTAPITSPEPEAAPSPPASPSTVAVAGAPASAPAQPSRSPLAAILAIAAALVAILLAVVARRKRG